MPCENYREALVDAAAAESAPSRELRSHLDACASCRTAFAEEQQLFAAIDTGLRATANAEVPASLLPRVRAQLSEQPVSNSVWVPAFAGVALAAVLVFAFFLARKPTRVDVEPNPVAISTAPNAPPAGNQPATPAIVPLEVARSARKHSGMSMAKTTPAAVATSTTAQVLIPAGQKQALDVLLARLQQGDLQSDALPVERPDKPLETLEVSPLDILPIEIKPLPEVGTESATPDEKTGR
jgi:hypothetical protein